MNNPLMLVKAFRNPQEFLNQAINNNQIMQNPIGRNAIEMYQKGDMQGLNELASNLCKEKGTTQEEIINKLKSQLGI